MSEEPRQGFDRTALLRRLVAWRYLRGQGIEVGALHNPLPVPPWARVRYVDRMSREELQQHYQQLAALPLVRVDIIDDGERLATIGDATLRFVIANSFLEHCQDPLGALASFTRVLRPSGIVFAAIPDKRFTFDRRRPVTPIEHVVRDHREGPAWSRAQHFEEWARWVAGLDDPEAMRAEARRLEAVDYSIHFHAWTQAEILELVAVATRELGMPLLLELLMRLPEESLLVLRKVELERG